MSCVGKYKDAMETFRNAMAEGEMTPELANNVAVCALHCNQIKRAIECLESLVKASPQILTPELVSNLNLLYDFGVDNPTARKQWLQDLFNYYKDVS